MRQRRTPGRLRSKHSVAAPHERSADRRGTVIVIVTILVALLALGAYTFSHFMAVETRASGAFGREAQARALADSGVDLAAALLIDRAEQDPQSFYNNTEMFQGILLRDSSSARGRGRFSVVASVEADPSGQSVRFGMIDESSKINLNKLSDLGLDDTQSRALLMALPQMTESIADSILDFLDADDTRRELGNENEYYAGLGISARNGPIESLDELLLVPEVTPLLLFGEDANRNGILDPNENDGDKSLPLDDANGILFPGWVHYLTIHSRELNVQADGTARLDANMNALGELFDKIEPILGQEAATFVVAYRLAGPYQDPSAQQNGTTGTGVASAGGAGASGGGNSMGSGSGSGGGSKTPSSGGGGGGSSGGSKTAQSGGGSKSSGGSTTTTPVAASAASGGATTITPTAGSGGSTTITARQVGGQVANSAQTTTPTQTSPGQGVQKVTPGQGGSANAVTQAASTAANAIFSANGQVTRNGIDLTNGAKFQLVSLYDLIGAQVQVKVNGTDTILASPWPADASAMKGYLPKLFDALAVNTSRFIEGRINVNQARLETLMGIPGMNEQMASAIVSQQQQLLGSSSASTDMATTGWLYIHKIADLPTLSNLDKYMTARGDVFRVQSVGYFDEGGVGARVEAVIDATVRPPQVVFRRDLTNLGVGFTSQMLSGGK